MRKCARGSASPFSRTRFRVGSSLPLITLALLFTVTGFLQMYVWAVKKHKGYLKTYGDAYKKLHRKAIIPFLL